MHEQAAVDNKRNNTKKFWIYIKDKINMKQNNKKRITSLEINSKIINNEQ